MVIEINDQTHLTEDRRERDKKVANICEEAGIPIITLWTSYGVNQEYTKKRITETLSALGKKCLDILILLLQSKGIEDTPDTDVR